MSDDIVARLRAELAAERENNKSLNKHLTRARGNTETMKAERDAIRMLADDWRVRCGWARSEIETLRAERDALRAELAASTHKIISQRSSTGSERPTSNREVEGSTPSVEAALRAELAAETETVMRLTAELSGVKACLKSLEKHFARAKGNTQSMKLSRNAARSERDELRATISSELDDAIQSESWDKVIAVRDRLDAALNDASASAKLGGGKD